MINDFRKSILKCSTILVFLLFELLIFRCHYIHDTVTQEAANVHMRYMQARMYSPFMPSLPSHLPSSQQQPLHQIQVPPTLPPFTVPQAVPPVVRHSAPVTNDSSPVKSGDDTQNQPAFDNDNVVRLQKVLSSSMRISKIIFLRLYSCNNLAIIDAFIMS